MATRRIKITGKNPRHSPTNTKAKGKDKPETNTQAKGTKAKGEDKTKSQRKKPRCHGVRMYFKKDGTKVREHQRPKLCIYIPQTLLRNPPKPITSPSIPDPPPPPKLPPFKPIKFPRRLSVKQEKALGDALRAIEKMKTASRTEFLRLREQIDDALRALGLVDSWGIATDFEVALRVKKIIQEGNELTFEQARDFITRAKSGNILVPVNLRNKKTFFYDDYLELAENLIGQTGIRVDSKMREALGKKVKIPQGMGGKTPEEAAELIRQTLKENAKNKEAYKKALEQLAKQNQEVLEQGHKEIGRYMDELAQTYGDDFWRMLANSADDAAQIGGKAVATTVLNTVIGATFAAVDVGLRKARGEDNFRAFGAAAASIAGSTAAGAACIGTGLATGGIGLGICAGIGSFAATLAFETANDTIRNQPEGLPTPKPTPKPSPSPAPPPNPNDRTKDRSPSNDRENDRRPTHPDFTCVIRKDGTGYWRRKKGTPKDAPKPSIPCQPL